MERLALAGGEAQTLTEGLTAAQQGREPASLCSGGNGADLLLLQFLSY